MSLNYSLRVNGREVIRYSEASLNVFFTMEIIGGHVNMMDSSVAGLQRREYRDLSCAIRFKHSTKDSWGTVAFKGFNFVSGVRLYSRVDMCARLATTCDESKAPFP